MTVILTHHSLRTERHDAVPIHHFPVVATSQHWQWQIDWGVPQHRGSLRRRDREGCWHCLPWCPGDFPIKMFSRDDTRGMKWCEGQ